MDSVADQHLQFMQEYALDRDCTILSCYALQQHSFSPKAQDLSVIMNRSRLAAKLIARRLIRASWRESQYRDPGGNGCGTRQTPCPDSGSY